MYIVHTVDRHGRMVGMVSEKVWYSLIPHKRQVQQSTQLAIHKRRPTNGDIVEINQFLSSVRNCVRFSLFRTSSPEPAAFPHTLVRSDTHEVHSDPQECKYLVLQYLRYTTLPCAVCRSLANATTWLFYLFFFFCNFIAASAGQPLYCHSP